MSYVIEKKGNPISIYVDRLHNSCIKFSSLRKKNQKNVHCATQKIQLKCIRCQFDDFKLKTNRSHLQHCNSNSFSSLSTNRSTTIVQILPVNIEFHQHFRYVSFLVFFNPACAFMHFKAKYHALPSIQCTNKIHLEF